MTHHQQTPHPLPHTHTDLDHELQIDNEGFVRILKLNRPERRNALSESLKYKIIHEFLNAQEDDSVRVIVLTGSGESAFCSCLLYTSDAADE